MERVLLTGSEAAKAAGATLLGRGDTKILCVTTDSRNCTNGCAFIPLRGEQDGHKYCADAIKLGAKTLIIDDTAYNDNKSYYDDASKSCCVLVTKNTLTALQDIAAYYVEKFPNLIKVAITGSSGKTTTKELLVAILREKFSVVCNKGNFNSETGLPLSVFSIDESHEVGVFEMGMNRIGEIKEISRVLKAPIALITNIGTAHIGILGSQRNIAEEKKHIFDYLTSDGAAFLNPMDEFEPFLKEGLKAPVIPFGNFVNSDISGIRYIKDCGLNGTDFSLDGVEIHLPLPGVYNYTNALGAVAVAKRLGLDATQIKSGLEKAQTLDGRMDKDSVTLKNGKRATLIKDFYNANPDSMKKALEFCSTLKGRVIYVLGDMLELGDKSFDAHTAVGSIVATDKSALCVFLGAEMRAAYEKALSRGKKGALYFPTSGDEDLSKAATFILDNAQDGDLILLKASRGLRFERFTALLTGQDEGKRC